MPQSVLGDDPDSAWTLEVATQAATRGCGSLAGSSPGLHLAVTVAAVVAATGCVWALIALPVGVWRHGFDTRAGRRGRQCLAARLPRYAR